jgi:hypothetical protein
MFYILYAELIHILRVRDRRTDNVCNAGYELVGQRYATKIGFLKVQDIFKGPNVHGTVCARKPVSRRLKIATILGKRWEEERIRNKRRERKHEQKKNNVRNMRLRQMWIVERAGVQDTNVGGQTYREQTWREPMGCRK